MMVRLLPPTAGWANPFVPASAATAPIMNARRCMCPPLHLLRFDAGEGDHLAPLLGFRGDQLAELRRTHRQGNAAEVGEALLYFRIRQAGVDLRIEPRDDFGGRVARRADAV